jgi:TolB-like protein/Tfp pilus assembly protein PilF
MGETESSYIQRWRTLRSGRVARVAIAYAAAGWLLVQVASTMLVPLGLPDWALQSIIVLVIAGFFVALVVAWSFHRGKGERGDVVPTAHDADASGTITPPSPGLTASAADPSVAVLAFADMSADRDQAWFCEGTAEEIINALAGVHGLRVASRSGSFQFRDRSVDNREVARLLDVRAVLEGSVRKAGHRVRVAAQLVAADGVLLWSETFDRLLEDIFAIQEEIARATVRALRVTLLAGDAARLERRGTANLAAYEFFLRGRQLMRREKVAEQRSAALLFREAVRLDSQFADAHAALASVLAHMRLWHDEHADFDEARQASLRALELEPGRAASHTARAQVLEIDGKTQEAAASFERAIAIDPRHFDAHYYFARFLAARGDHAGAVLHYTTAFDIRPDDHLPMTLPMQEYRALGDPAGELAAARRTWIAIEKRLAIDPDDSAAYDHGSGVLALMGRADEGRRFRERALALRPDDPMTHYNSACSAAIAGDYEVALDLLERSIQLGKGNRHSLMQWIMNDADLVPLHDHPRFKQMLAQLA